MSEQHRVSFTTLGSSKKQSKSKPKSDTVRITINLTEPSGDSCPVFSYTALVNSVERKKKSEKVVNGSIDHIHDCDEDQLNKIALQYEAKYGTKENRCSNYKELGAGYDDGDSFIDNSEALDEALSEQVEPEYGGYYVNTGELQLRHLDGSENSDDEELNVRTHNLKRAAKAIVSDSEEEESEDEEEEEEGDEDGGDSREDNQTVIKEVKLPVDKVAESMDVDELKSESVPNETDKVRNKSNGEIRSKKKQKRKLEASLSDNQVEKKKKKFSSKSLTVKKLLEEKRIAEAPSECADKESLKKLHNSVNDVIESVVKASKTDNSILDKDSDISNGSSSTLSRNGDINDLRDKTTDKTPPAPPQVPSLSTSASQMNLSSNPYVNGTMESTPLPKNLPEDVIELINFIKENSINSQSLGKSKFFSPVINSKLLSLECKCRDLPARHAIYGHLACFVPCGKETLMKRAKNLLIDVEEEKLRNLIFKLKGAVDRIMPVVIEKYSEACQRASKEKYIEDSVSGCASSNSETRPKTKVPRRVFPWDDKLKKYVSQIIETRLRLFKLVKSRKDTAEDFVQSFVATKMKPLWPHGWMKVSAILKVGGMQQLINASKRNTATINYQKKVAPTVSNTSNLNAPAPVNSTPALTTVSSPAPIPASTTVPESNQHVKKSAITSTNSNSFKDKFKQNETSLPEIDMFSDPIDLLSKITSAISPNSSQQQQNCVKPSSSPLIHNANMNHRTSPNLPKHEKSSSSVLVENKKPVNDSVISKNNSFHIDHLMDFSKKESPSGNVNSSSNCRTGSQSYPKSSNDQVLDLSPVKTPVSQNHKSPETEGSKPVSLKHRILQESKKAQAETDLLYLQKESKPPKPDYEKTELGPCLKSERDVYVKTELEYREDFKKSTYEDIKYQNESMKPPPPVSVKEDVTAQDRKQRSQSFEECEASMEAVLKNLKDLHQMSGNKSNNTDCNFALPPGIDSAKYNNNLNVKLSDPSQMNLQSNERPVEAEKQAENLDETASIPKVALGFQAEFYKHLLNDTPKEKSSVTPPSPNQYPSHEEHISRSTDPNLKNKGYSQPSSTNHRSVIVPVSTNQSGWQYRDQNYYNHEPSQSQH